MITIDYQSRTPIYEQVAEKFQMLILTGALPPGSQLPSVRSLAVELSINPNTIQKAFTLLEQQGFIYPVKGRGNFAADNEQLLKRKQEACLKDLEALLLHARKIKIPEADCHALITRIFKEVSHD